MGNASSELLKRPISTVVPKDQKLVWIEHDASVASALTTLKESGLTNIPVRDADDGTISFSDLVHFLVHKEFAKDEFLNAATREAVRKHHSILVQADSTIESVILRMLKYRPYRVCITSDADSTDIQSVVSQTDLIRFIYEHREALLGDLLKKDLLHLAKLGNKGKVVSVEETISVADACKNLLEKHVHAVAVCDDKGIMVGAITPTTFRSLSAEHFPDFSRPIKDFEVEGRDAGWVVAETTLEEVLQKIVEHHLHRVFVVTDAQHPGRVITLSDIMRFFINSTEEGREARAKFKAERRARREAKGKHKKKDKK